MVVRACKMFVHRNQPVARYEYGVNQYEHNPLVVTVRYSIRTLAFSPNGSEPLSALVLGLTGYIVHEHYLGTRYGP